MIWLILSSIYIMVPAYFANMSPVIVHKLSIMKGAAHPIDGNVKFFDKKPIFGKHKTYRGVLFGVLASILFAFIQYLLAGFSFFARISVLNYSSWLTIGILIGIGAMGGDMLKSFFKRRVGIASGKKFIPFDQIDFILGSYLLLFPFYYTLISIPLLLSSLIVSFLFHIITNHIAYYLKIRKEKW